MQNFLLARSGHWYSGQHTVHRLSTSIRLALFGMLAILPLCASAQIFECIDANGKKEFAQKCSPGTVKQREVAKGGASNSSASSPPQTSYKEEEYAFRQRQMEREANEAKARVAAEDAAKKCEAARARLTGTENARRLTTGTDPQTGQIRYLDDNERAAATGKARDAVSAYCK